jgi:hypothetical protein
VPGGGFEGFAQKNFASKQNEAKKSDPFCMRFARSREKKSFFSLQIFASNYSEIKTAFFHFVLLSIIFCFASFRFHFFYFTSKWI